MLYDVIEEFAARNVLHNHENIRRSANHLVSGAEEERRRRRRRGQAKPLQTRSIRMDRMIDSQFDDVWMAKEFHVLYFAFDFPGDVERANFASIQNLHRHLVLRVLVFGDYGERAECRTGYAICFLFTFHLAERSYAERIA